LNQVTTEIAGPFLLVNDDRPQPSPDVGIETPEECGSFFGAHPKVAKPSVQITVQSRHALSKRLTPSTGRKLPNFGIHAFLGTGRDVDLDLPYSTLAQPKAKKVHLCWPGNFTLLLVHKQS
jgi:hypothetical protein